MKLGISIATVTGALALSLSYSAAAQADAIPGLFSTGVDALAIGLADGAVDPHYALTVSPDAAFKGPSAFVANAAYPLPPAGPWVADSLTVKWISQRADAGNGTATGTFVFTLPFSLKNLDEKTATLTLNVAADNHTTIFLNGVTTGLTWDTFSSTKTFVIPSTANFVAGANKLEFHVLNDGGPVGLWVAGISGTANFKCGGDGLAGGCSLAKPACVTSGAALGTCVECLGDTHCVGNLSGSLCDTAKTTCGKCTSASTSGCVSITPVCDTTPTHDLCVACDGDNGKPTSHPCSSAASPVCLISGACVECGVSADCKTATKPLCGASHACAACNGDVGGLTTAACASSAAPTCTLTGASAGSCGKCTSDADCGTGHTGPFCNKTSGACSSLCFSDAECGSGRWCNDLGAPGAGGACTPKVDNGVAVPGGSCVTATAARACTSGVCDTDGRCGYLIDSGPCDATTGAAVCRSAICPTSGTKAGKCEACVIDADCKTTFFPACSTVNTCVECTSNTQCSGVKPICDVAGVKCAACDGDNGATSSHPCPTAGSPYCTSTGACGKCTTSADCKGSHLGPICDATSGACGSTCRSDADCDATTQWCNAAPSATGSCVAKIANGTALPTTPTGLDKCTDPIGKRICASGVCDVADDLCGLATGDGPCTTATAASCRDAVCGKDGKCGALNGDPCAKGGDCRSATCASDGKCGKPDGTACGKPEECRSALCTGGTCGAGATDAGPDAGDAGDSGDGATDAGADTSVDSGSDASGDIGGDVSVGDGGGDASDGADDSALDASSDGNVIEGGGCACKAATSSSGDTFGYVASALGALGLAWARRRRSHDKQA